MFSVGEYSLCFFKTVIDYTKGSPQYINVNEITNEEFVTLLAVIKDSKSNRAKYIFTGDSSEEFPENSGKNHDGFWVYFESTQAFWISVICIVKNK